MRLSYVKRKGDFSFSQRSIFDKVKDAKFEFTNSNVRKRPFRASPCYS